MKKLRTVTLAAALLVASVPSLSTTADARPFGFGGGFGHGGFGHGGFGGGGWGGGWAAAVGAAAVGAAAVGAGAVPESGSASGLPQVHSSGPHSPALITAMDTVIRMAMVTITLTTMPRLTAIEPSTGHLTGATGDTTPTEPMATGTTVTGIGYRHYGYGVRHAAYGVSRIGYGGYRVGYAGYGGGLRYGRSVGHGYRAGFAGAGYGRGRFR